MSYTREDLLDFIAPDHPANYKFDYMEEILKEIFLSMRTRKLTNMEYVFIAKSFCNKIFMMGPRYDKDDNYSNENFDTFINMATKATKLEVEFINDYYKLEVRNPGSGENLTDFKKLSKDMISVYKDIRDWMIKKGYEV